MSGYLNSRGELSHRRSTDGAVNAPSSIVLTPVTGDGDVASRWLERFGGGGIDGVVARSGKCSTSQMARDKRPGSAEFAATREEWVDYSLDTSSPPALS